MFFLFFLAYHEEDLEDGASAGGQFTFEIVDLVVAGTPYVFGIGAIDVRHDHIFIMGAVEYGNPPRLGQFTLHTPEEVVVEILGRRLAEAMVMDAHRVALAEHVTHDAALAGGIHALQHDEQPPCRAFDAIRVHEPLVSGDFGGADRNELLGVLFIAVESGSGIAFDISDLHAVVEHKTLSGRQRPYGAEQFTGFRRTCQSFRHAGTGVDGVYAIRREL